MTAVSMRRALDVKGTDAVMTAAQDQATRNGYRVVIASSCAAVITASVPFASRALLMLTAVMAVTTFPVSGRAAGPRPRPD